jgi:hypothetical protein
VYGDETVGGLGDGGGGGCLTRYEVFGDVPVWGAGCDD